MNARQPAKKTPSIREWLKTNQHSDAKYLLSWFLNHDDFWRNEIKTSGLDTMTWLEIHDDTQLPEEKWSEINVLLERRVSGEPLAHIKREKSFYGRNFKVTSETLIPRPETEIIIDLAKTMHPKTILDVGTGSGCIAVTLKLELPKSEITGIDISNSTLAIAEENARKFNAKVDFYCSDLLSEVKGDFDLIVANLPYVDKNWDWLDLKTLKHEPELALFADDGGLDLIFRLLESARTRCRQLLIEADPCQHQAIIKKAESLNYKHTKTVGFILAFGVKC